MSIVLEAAELRFALEWGYADLPEAKKWADKKILESETANTEIIDLALANSRAQAISILGKLSNTVDNWRMLRQFFKRFLEIDKIDISKAKRLAEYLYMKSSYEENSPKDMDVFWTHWDRIDGAIEGWGSETLEQAIEMFVNDLKSIAKTAP